MTGSAASAGGLEGAQERPTTVQIGVRLLLGLGVLIATFQIATFDLRHRPLVGDEASHVLQALSLAHDGNLSFDMADLDRFEAMEWAGARRPNGVFFQKYSHGWAFAKPYGWSATAAPLVRLLGPFPGLAVASALLFLTAIGAAVMIGRHAGRWGPEFAAASLLASVMWLYGFTAHTEMFLLALMSVTTLCIVQYRETDRLGWLISAAALSGFTVSEKPLFALLLAPVLIVLTWRRGFSRVLVCGAVTLAAFLLAIVPYLFYSDFDSWNPYAGERYYRADGMLPFAPDAPPLSSYRPMRSGENFDPAVVLDRATSDPAEGAQALMFELVGRHTGMLVFLPLTFAMLVMTLWPQREQLGRAERLSVAMGLVAYMLVYALVYPKNYYGGEQSLGNRYLVQAAPIILAGFAFARTRARVVLASGVAGFVAAAAFMYPHFLSPSDAFVRLERTSPIQELMPEEYTAIGVRLFRCGIPAVMWGPFEDEAERIDRIRAQEACLGLEPSV